MARRPSTINPMKSVVARRFLLLLTGLLIGLLAVAQIANAAPGADWSRIAVTTFEGDALSQPVAYGTEGAAGPWRLTLLEVHTGDDATKLVTDASGTNAPPPDGTTYVVLKLRAQNTGTTPLEIGNDDFGVASSSGVIRRFQEVVPPDPALAATLAPGASMDGWIVGAAATDDTNLVLVYDSTTIPGNYADATLALENGATLAPAGNRAVKLNKIGRSPDDPAGLDTQLATRNWVVQLNEVVTGADAVGLFPDSDVRTTALLGTNPNAADTWVAFQVTITNNQTGDQPAFLPPTAFTLADGDGNPVPDLSTLSPPDPDASGYYAPGASRDGWVVFDAAGYDGALLRFLPYRTDEDPRFIAYDGSAASSTANQPSFSGTLAKGTAVVTTEDGVRIRKTASTDADIVEEIPQGTKLTITGGPEDAGGFTWYPVKDDGSGKTGFVAQQFLNLAE
jgi:hypothetical protein